MRSPVDHEYPVPLYWQVAEAIKRQIADGVLNPGDKLPTEKWLTENYKVSRVTARKAVQTLIDNGTLEPYHCIPAYEPPDQPSCGFV